MEARAYPPVWRAASALLMVFSRGSMLVLLALLLFFDTRLSNPLRLARWFTLLCLLPEFAAWVIGRAYEAAVRVDAGALVVEQPRRRIEIPLDAISGFERWALPLPADGVWIRLTSGNRFHYGLHVARPEVLIDEVAAARGDQQPQPAAIDRSAIVRAAVGGAYRRWYSAILKFPVFALVPALPLFRLHQWITYGGTFGEYYLYGLEAYVLAFLIYWANATIWLVLYAAGLRVVVAIGVLAFAFAAPERASVASRVGDLVHRLLYFGGVAVFLVRLYMLSRV